MQTSDLAYIIPIIVSLVITFIILLPLYADVIWEGHPMYYISMVSSGFMCAVPYVGWAWVVWLIIMWKKLHKIKHG